MTRSEQVLNQSAATIEKDSADTVIPDKGTLVDQTINRIELDLRDGRFPPGAFMGTQADLCAAYGVSSPVFFQATRVLMHRGMVELRKGNGGGLFAVDNSIMQVGKRMATYLECIGVDFADAAPVSRLLQELCVRLATASLTLESGSSIRDIIRQIPNAIDHFDRGRLLSHMFQQFAEASGNEVLALLYRVITDVMLDVTIADPITADAIVPQSLIRDLGIQIGEAVIAADHEQAASSYLQFRDALLRWQMALPLSKETGEPLPSFANRSAESGNLPERLAAHILREIRQMGWPVGKKLGNEPDLLARYGVARATFRQAIRLLEEYSAVETKRGPKGGLLIASPSADAINETAQALLTARNATPEMARAILVPLMTLAVDIALARGPAASTAIADCCRETGIAPSSQLGKLVATVLHAADGKVLSLFVQLLGNFEARCSDAGAKVDVNAERFAQLLAALDDAAHRHDRLLMRGITAELVRSYGVGDIATAI